MKGAGKCDFGKAEERGTLASVGKKTDHFEFGEKIWTWTGGIIGSPKSQSYQWATVEEVFGPI